MLFLFLSLVQPFLFVLGLDLEVTIGIFNLIMVAWKCHEFGCVLFYLAEECLQCCGACEAVFIDNVADGSTKKRQRLLGQNASKTAWLISSALRLLTIKVVGDVAGVAGVTSVPNPTASNSQQHPTAVQASMKRTMSNLLLSFITSV